jgi:hypothetical protein
MTIDRNIEERGLNDADGITSKLYRLSCRYSFLFRTCRFKYRITISGQVPSIPPQYKIPILIGAPFSVEGDGDNLLTVVVESAYISDGTVDFTSFSQRRKAPLRRSDFPVLH